MMMYNVTTNVGYQHYVDVLKKKRGISIHKKVPVLVVHCVHNPDSVRSCGMSARLLQYNLVLRARGSERI